MTQQIEKLIEAQDIAALSKLIAPLKGDEIRTIFPGDLLCVPMSLNLRESLEGPHFYEVTNISTFKSNMQTGKFVERFEISGIFLNGQWKGKSRTQRFMDFNYNGNDGKYWVMTWIVFPTSEARAQRKKRITIEEESRGVKVDPNLDIL